MSLELEREQTVQVLCQQFAHDRLTTQELETRLEAAYKAANASELRALVAGLPALPMRADAAAAPSVSQPGLAGEERRILSVFATVKKKGDWEVGSATRAVSVFGELELDLREARIPPGLSTIHVSATFSSVKIIVPPGLHVECDGSAIFGEFSDKVFMSAEPGSDAPALRITGMAAFSEVKVVMRLPNETTMQALKREWRT